jgi:hypothetical protein
MSKAVSTVFILSVVLAILIAVPASVAQAPTGQWSHPIDITRPSDSEIGLWGALACDQYQNTHLFWSDMDPDNTAIYYRNNIGGNWSSPIDILVNPKHSALRLGAAVSNKTDTAHLIWVDRELRADLYYSQAPLAHAGDPRAWSAPRLLVGGTDGASLTVDKEGALHLVYPTYDTDGIQQTFYYIRSDDDGLTWSDPVVVFTMTAPLPSTSGVKIAADDTGRLHVGTTVRSYEYGAFSELGYVRSLDGGKTWGPYEKITDTGTTFQGVSTLAPFAFGNNEIHLTWHDPRRMHMWSDDGGETWSAPVEIMPLAPGFGGTNKLVKDSAGVIHAIVAALGGVYSVSWDGKQWGPPELIDDRGIDPHNQDLVACQGNELHVTYDDRNDQKKVWYSTRSVDAPHIEARPIPAQEEATVAIGLEPTPTPPTINLLPRSQGQAFSSELAPLPPNPTNLIVLAALPVLALIAGVYIARRWRR